MPRNVEVIRRHELLAEDCMQALLGASGLFREETIKHVVARLERGRPWHSRVRGRGGQGRRESNRRDVRKWRASVYDVEVECPGVLSFTSNDISANSEDMHFLT